MGTRHTSLLVQTPPVEPGTGTSESATRAGAVWTVLRRLVLGAFAGTVLLIVLLVGMAVLGAVGVLFDPHGYGVIFGVVLAAVLAPVALALWLLHQSLRRRGT
jgi:hypothetical protein